MVLAGYSPYGATGFRKRFAAYNNKRGGKSPEFRGTHPLDNKCIAQIEALLLKVEAEYRAHGR